MPTLRLAPLVALAVALPLGACRTNPRSTTIDVTTGTPPADSGVVPSSGAQTDGTPAPAPGPATDTARVLFDVAAGTIGGVDFDRSGSELRMALGADRVRTETGHVEGTTRPRYVARVEGVEVTREAFLARFTDPRIRTSEGLGVGSTVGQWGDAYGHTEMDDGEEGQCKGASFFHGRGFRVCMDRTCESATCRVRSVEFLTEVDAATGNAAQAGPDPAPAGQEPTASDAEAVIDAYYDAIDAGRIRDAYRLWADEGRRSGKTYTAFAEGYAETRAVAANVGTAGRVDAGAGQRYVTVPVVVNAVLKNGREQRFEGSYTLRRTVVDGASAEQRAWRIDRASLRQVQ